MSNVVLKAIKIANFKGFSTFEANFSVPFTNIMGANGSGKSSIYDAYMWALFGKNQQGKEQNVQPLDKNNNTIHKLTTSVELTLDVDGVETKIRREQREDWVVPRGTSEEVLKGRKQDRYINEVPYSAREFDSKLSSICDINHWFVLSSISAFMDVEQDKRRKFLQSITGELDELGLAKKYPRVLKAFEEGRTLEEVLRLNKSTRTTAQRDLDEIPARIDQQERLRVNIDVSEIEKEKAEAQAERDSLDAQLREHQNKRPSDNSSDYITQMSAIDEKIYNLKSSAQSKRAQAISQIREDKNSLSSELSKVSNLINSATSDISILTKQKSLNEELLANARKEWENANKRTYTDSVETICPVCGQELPEDSIESARTKAIELFNSQKVAEMDLAIKKGQKYKDEITLSEYKIAEKESEISTLKIQLEELESKIQESESLLLDATNAPLEIDNEQYAELMEQKNALSKLIEEAKQSSQSVIADFNNRTNELMSLIRAADMVIASCNSKLATVATNGRIDKEKERLLATEKDLVQVVAECDHVDFEIKEFKKAKISIVEDRVSSLFSLVHWKMYESNLTNDGEKEICQAIINGVPYEQTNTATRINAGIDIVNGISNALECCLPLFVDNAESVTDLMVTPSQLITLTVSAGQELTIK